MKYNSFFDSIKPKKTKEESNDIMCCGMPYKNEGNYMCCSKCGIIKPIIINETANSIIFENRIIKQVYSRKIHFKKIILQIQGREVFHNNAFPKIKEYLEQNNITDYSTTNIKNVLFNLKLNSYYLHIQLIRRYLGCPMVIMSDELMERLMRLFQVVEEQIKTIGNMPNYHFILLRLLHFLGHYEFDPLLKRLKNETKLNIVWSRIRLE